MSLNPSLLKPKHHFEVLDGLRGVAAIGVVTFHFMEMIITDYSKNFIGHGFLAVDFFFCLSGFVIAYAYDDRIGKMGFRQFAVSRLIRLHPLVIMGSVLGLLAFLFDPFSSAAASYNLPHIALIFICSLLMIPYGAITERSFNNFGLNAPAWSLFWEYVANVVYALILVRFRRPILVVLLIVSAAWLSYVAWHAQSLAGGWSKDNFWDGGARVSYSFIAGMLIYRYRLKISNRLGFIGLAILLIAALVMPYFPLNWLAELLVVLLWFPLLLMLGVGTNISDKTKKLCTLSGNISYPLYMTHYFVLWIFLNYTTAHKPSTNQLIIIIISGILGLLAFGYFVMKFYDEPLRMWLNNKRKRIIS
ncbi:acyltransferase family protein [Mucilaginibacter ginkgonis]|uniref:Acyltransferase n=1 Tax=Mucilaginibacter ginkgonis TaxID=2682091 RepID=A0A6I4HWP7_9SPHI|nr:acyltransferase [Mucilaginibacter ginkgonis]QQL51262.1 acyltransferase [Mucilaginibacter ginkgonis]